MWLIDGVKICDIRARDIRIWQISALSWNKILYMKLQSLKLLKTTKDTFYKQSDFFANWQGRLFGFVNLVHYDGVQLRSRDVMKYFMF